MSEWRQGCRGIEADLGIFFISLWFKRAGRFRQRLNKTIRGLIFFVFSLFFNDFHKYASDSILSKIYPGLGAKAIGAELTHLSTHCFGSKI